MMKVGISAEQSSELHYLRITFVPARYLFEVPFDLDQLVKIIERSAALHDMVLQAYTLVPRAVHLLAYASKSILNPCLENICGSYTTYMNQRLGRSGALFSMERHDDIARTVADLQSVIGQMNDARDSATVYRHWSVDNLPVLPSPKRLSTPLPNHPVLSAVVQQVIADHNVSLEEIQSSSANKNVAVARAKVASLLRERDVSYDEIATLLQRQVSSVYALVYRQSKRPPCSAKSAPPCSGK